MPSCGRGLFLALLLLQLSTLISAQKSKPNSTWQTLRGNAPIVIAKGGFSGLFPDSSSYAYAAALQTSLPNLVLWCDVQLTKDGVGICLPDVKMDNCTDIVSFYPKSKKIYPVNGMRVGGWFSVDYTFNSLTQFALTQGIYSRSDRFDFTSYILTVEDVVRQYRPPGLWLNIQHDLFYRQHNLSMRSYLLSVSRRVIVNYVSSPEVDFLSSVVARLKGSKTKLIFRFLEADTIEPSTNLTYGSLSKNLTFVKTFASGILIPRNYIWPTADLYLLPHTSIVSDAHRIGLEVYASGFANDNLIAYNYSYDPISEYVSFIDNGDFAVDGVLSDFPVTASEAIGCFSHINKNISRPGVPTTVISHNGASGIYPGCTDLAYQQAVDDGTDFIDCPVQVTKDGILVCMNNINLIDGTTLKQQFSSRSSIVPEIQSGPGYFTFNLTWEEIKSLKPQMSTPEFGYRIVRNPLFENSGKFVTLSDFLDFAKGRSLSGVLISIEYAAFYAAKMGFSLTDAVLKVLKDSGYDNQTQHEVMIQSTHSSVLIKFKQLTDYKLMYKVDELISDVSSSPIQDIRKFAHSVAVTKKAIYPDNHAFITGQTHVVEKLQAANLSVYVYLLMNEFVSQAWDFYSDPTVEINSFVQGAGVDGVITDYPGTASAYRRNTCLKLGNSTPSYMLPVQPGGLLSLMNPVALPPAKAAFPPLTDNEVVELALPPVSQNPPSAGAGGNAGAPGTSVAPGSTPPSGQPRNVASIFACFAVLFGSLMLV